MVATYSMITRWKEGCDMTAGNAGLLSTVNRQARPAFRSVSFVDGAVWESCVIAAQLNCSWQR